MKKYFSLLLILFFCFCIAGCDTGTPDDKQPENPNSTNKVTQDLNVNVEMHKLFEKQNPYTEVVENYIYIGYYPQREVLDTDMLGKLNAIDVTNERGYIECDGYEFAKITVVNNHIYDESTNSDATFEYGTNYQVGTTHYFLVEPICWKVINSANGELFLLTENVITCKEFNIFTEIREVNGVEVDPSDYEHSSIRDWLNSTFYNICFTDEEKLMIQESYNENNPIYIFDTDKVQNPTVDKVFLLSHQEVTNSNYNFYNSASRQAAATDYARANGLINHVFDAYSSSSWWVRIGYEYGPFHGTMIKYDGTTDNPFYPDGPNIGVRPAIKIILN